MLADTQEAADTVCSLTRSTLLPLRLSGAWPTSPATWPSVLALRRPAPGRSTSSSLCHPDAGRSANAPVSSRDRRRQGECAIKKCIDIARVVRSKNSGPYELVLDIMLHHLKDSPLFDALKDSGQFSPERVARPTASNSPKSVASSGSNPANAVKVVMPRPVSGAPGDADVPTARSGTRAARHGIRSVTVSLGGRLAAPGRPPPRREEQRWSSCTKP